MQGGLPSQSVHQGRGQGDQSAQDDHGPDQRGVHEVHLPDHGMGGARTWLRHPGESSLITARSFPMAKKAAAIMEVPVDFGTLSVGDKTTRLSVSISRGRDGISISQADKTFCDR